jgi:O-antigen/teichoic acid export membrane protein
VNREGDSLLKKASPLIIGRGLTALLTFAIPIVLARKLDPASYGTYKQFFLIAVTLYLGGQLGLSASLYYFVPRARGDGGRYVIQALACLFVLGALAAGGILLGGESLARRFANPELAALTVPLALYTWGVLAAAPLEVALTATGRTGWSGIVYVFSDAVRSAAMVVPVALGWGLSGLAWSAVIFAALRLVAAWLTTIAVHQREARRPELAALRAQLAYAVPFGGAVLLAVAQMQLPQYVVASLTDAAVFAIFAVGALQLPVTDLLYGPIAEVMMVRLAQVRQGGEPPIFREAVARLAMFFLPLCAFAWATGPELIVTLYTSKYAAAAPIFMVAATEILLATLPVDGLLRALGATRFLFFANAARLAASAVVVPLALVAFGLPGAMAGHVLTQVFAKALLMWAASRRLGVPMLELLPVRELGAWSMRSVAVFVSVEGVRVYGPWHGWTFFAVALPLGGALWILSVMSAGELRTKEATIA